MPKQIFRAWDPRTSQYANSLDYTAYRPTKLYLKVGATTDIRMLCTCPFCGKTGFANNELGGILFEHQLERTAVAGGGYTLWHVTQCCSRFGTNNYEAARTQIYQLLNKIDGLRVANACGTLSTVAWSDYSTEDLYMAIVKRYILPEQLPEPIRQQVQAYTPNIPAQGQSHGSNHSQPNQH